jgi:hypothetical protein
MSPMIHIIPSPDIYELLDGQALGVAPESLLLTDLIIAKSLVQDQKGDNDRMMQHICSARCVEHNM